MKTGLVLEGGALQGLYTVGVLDYFMENEIHFDGAMGVSAGALFGVNYLSGQNGRAIRYNKRFNKDKNYMGILPLLKTGNIVDTDYAFYQVPHKLDPFDNEKYMASGVPFYAVATNIRTGKAEYIHVKDVFQQMDVLRASGSMPFVSKPVLIDGELYLDGAIDDSIPYKKMMEMGYDQLVVILTKSKEYVKKPMPKLLAKLFYQRKYPKFAKKIINRHIMYNNQIKGLHKLAKGGKVKIIQPSIPFYIKKLETDPEQMEKLYQLGRKDAESWLKANQGFLQPPPNENY